MEEDKQIWVGESVETDTNQTHSHKLANCQLNVNNLSLLSANSLLLINKTLIFKINIVFSKPEINFRFNIKKQMIWDYGIS